VLLAGEDDDPLSVAGATTRFFLFSSIFSQFFLSPVCMFYLSCELQAMFQPAFPFRFILETTSN
jgi:hypothetical protein